MRIILSTIATGNSPRVPKFGAGARQISHLARGEISAETLAEPVRNSFQPRLSNFHAFPIRNVPISDIGLYPIPVFEARNFVSLVQNNRSNLINNGFGNGGLNKIVGRAILRHPFQFFPSDNPFSSHKGSADRRFFFLLLSTREICHFCWPVKSRNQSGSPPLRVQTRSAESL